MRQFLRLTTQLSLSGPKAKCCSAQSLMRDHYQIFLDQKVPHLELSREIVRKFNRLYKTKLPEPKPLLTEAVFSPDSP